MTLSSTPSTSASLMPLMPFRSLSSMYSEMYSGERALRLRNTSKACGPRSWVVGCEGLGGIGKG